MQPRRLQVVGSGRRTRAYVHRLTVSYHAQRNLYTRLAQSPDAAKQVGKRHRRLPGHAHDPVADLKARLVRRPVLGQSGL